MAKRKKVGPRGEAGAKEAQVVNRKRTQPTTPEPSKPAASYYFLHVLRDGSEVHYATAQYGIPTLRVEIIDLGNGRRVEQTKTRNDRRDFYNAAVQPHGYGWKFHEDCDDHCVWRRRQRKGGTS